MSGGQGRIGDRGEAVEQRGEKSVCKLSGEQLL